MSTPQTSVNGNGKSLRDLVCDHDKSLFGDPLNLQGAPGLVVRVDRLEQKIAFSWKAATVIITASFTLLQILFKMF